MYGSLCKTKVSLTLEEIIFCNSLVLNNPPETNPFPIYTKYTKMLFIIHGSVQCIHKS